jgi:preprotein translocase subunit SecE
MANPSNTAVETVNSGADKVKWALAAALIVGGLVAFHALGKQDLWVRTVALLVLIAAGIAVFATSLAGKELIGFGRDSYREVRKVVWPTRKEAMQTTGFVFAFVVVMAIFLWLTDKSLEWLLYDLILGWRK